MSRCLKYHFPAGDSRHVLPPYVRKNDLIIPCVPANFEQLGILVRIDATPDEGKIITQSHGEIIEGQWVEVIDEQKTPAEIAEAEALAVTDFNFRDIVNACGAIDSENSNTALMDKIDAIMTNKLFNYHLIGAAGVVNINDTTTQQALAVFSADEINVIKLKIAGL